MFRWSQILADFDLEEISYIPGEQNVVADYLSRLGDSLVTEEHQQLQEEIELRADLVNLDPTLLCVIRSEIWKGEIHEQTVHVNALTQDNLLADDIKKNYDGDKYFSCIPGAFMKRSRQDRLTTTTLPLSCINFAMVTQCNEYRIPKLPLSESRNYSSDVRRGHTTLAQGIMDCICETVGEAGSKTK